jgi:hypothetical protein
MFFTYKGVHLNMAYVSGFGWVDGEVRVTNDKGELNCLPDPDRSLYLQMCEKAGVMPEPPTKEEV